MMSLNDKIKPICLNSKGGGVTVSPDYNRLLRIEFTTLRV